MPLSLECFVGSFALMSFFDLTFVQSEFLLPLFSILGYSAMSFWYEKRYGRTGERALEGFWHGAKRVAVHVLVGTLLYTAMWFVLSLAVWIDFSQPWVSVRGLATAGVYLLFRWY